MNDYAIQEILDVLRSIRDELKNLNNKLGGSENE